MLTEGPFCLSPDRVGSHPRTDKPQALPISASETYTIVRITLSFNPELSRDQNIVRNGNIKIGDLSFEEVGKFKYLGPTVLNINDTREESKRRINMGNACYYSVEKLLSSSLLSKKLKVRIYKTIILPVVLHDCETWTLTLREEQRLRMFENKVLRKIFGAKRDEVTGEWRKLHNAKLHTLYSSPDIIRNIKFRRLRWAGHVARMGESRNAYIVLVGRPEGKRPLGRPIRRCKKLKGLQLIRASWEAFLQHCNICLSLIRADNPHVNMMRQLDVEHKSSCDSLCLSFPEHYTKATIRNFREEFRGREYESWKTLSRRGKGVEMYSEVTAVNSWIANKKGLSTSEWITSLKMTANLAAVRSIPGRSLDGTRCRHGCPEIETLAHVLGFCEQGLLLRNSRHHLVRSKIAAALRNKGWIVEEEISCLAENGSTRRVQC
ncbi:hypothetical protein ANN_11693 [Periplaneta americana]|uniref:Uncharacterized protein n=1 Tax=Periplaneta americana TaxID=6978 RepID=A0ABQ8T5S5_PERAM|nr:hypothetical protein ANN_11693 [Periplaneta americana]